VKIPEPFELPPNNGAAYSASGNISGCFIASSTYTPGIQILHFPLLQCFITYPR
jgi:hypothetical protein